MSNIIIIISYPLIIYLINSFLTKKNLIPNYSGDEHQRFFEKDNIQLSGGIFIIPILLMITFNYSLLLTITIISIFLLGLFSDIGFFSSAKYRFLVQAIIILLFIIFSETKLTSVRIETFDLMLENNLFNLFFTLFCLMILINGTNFIDGLNGLVLSYYLSILIIIFNLGLFEYSVLSNDDIFLIIIIFIYLILFNIFNQLYIGDSGSYLIGFVIGYFMIQIYENELLFSPYFIALLLWYPAFEILFSILRKIIYKKSPFTADNKHFHHLLFLHLSKKYELSNNFSNNLCSFLIILFNIIIFYIATFNIYYTALHVSLFIFNISVYLFVYLKLYKTYYE